MARERPRRAHRRSGTGLVIVSVVLVCAILMAAGVVAWRLRTRTPNYPEPLPAEQCVASTSTASVSLSLEQSANAAIIVAESIRRGLPARAASIALTTAYQESGLLNLEYGDRDSIGLFQQRPSQGWGTRADIMDPWYAAGRFYQELVKFDGWQTGDITTYAQKVQRSGYPEAYRKHENNARVVASVLTGNTTAAFTCMQRDLPAQGTAAIVTLLTRAFGSSAKITAQGNQVTITSSSPQTVWAGVQLAMATTQNASVIAASVGGQTWKANGDQPTSWQGTPSTPETTGVITVSGDEPPTPSP